MLKPIKTIFPFLLLLASIFIPSTISAENRQVGTATVFIIRQSVLGAAFKATIVLNNNQIGKLNSRRYFKCIVPPGDITVSATLENEDALTLHAESGGTYYVILNPTIGLVSARVSLATLNPQDGVASIAKCKLQDVAEFVPSGHGTPTEANTARSTISEWEYSARRRYTDTKEKALTISRNRQNLSLSDNDKTELRSIIDMLSDVNKNLTAISKNQLSQPQKSQTLANIDKVLDFIDKRLDKYTPVLAMQPERQPAAVIATSAEQPSDFNNPPQNRPESGSDVDIDIPLSNTKAENTFVLIIANENYEFVDDVQFALNDGETFKKYCIRTLGIPERQVWLYKNASAGIIAGGIDKMVQAMSIFDNAKAIVYYCGHGIPDEKTGEAYIVPTDGRGTNIATCYSLNRMYKALSASKATSVTYFMDACFSGANREGSMLVAARGVAREAKKEMIEGNTIVFSAASSDETAMPYTEKKHGLFTYFLLKKLQETKGDVSYGELAEYIRNNVRKEAFLTNEKLQNPVVATSEQSASTWKNIRIK